MDTNKMREQFEAWHAENFPEPKGHSGSAPSAKKSRAARKEALFFAWQASREAVLVDLQAEIDGYVRERREAIEAQGLKVAS